MRAEADKMRGGRTKTQAIEKAEAFKRTFKDANGQFKYQHPRDLGSERDQLPSCEHQGL